eukprot:5996008-Prorocentrum_lima.AAC.1
MNPQRAKQLDDKLTPEEVTEFRSCIGSAQWLTGNSRPDQASTVSLSEDGDLRIKNLMAAHL